MNVQVRTLVVLPFCLILNHWAWGQQELKPALEAALSYPPLQAFWCEDQKGESRISYVDLSRKMTLIEGLDLSEIHVPAGNNPPSSSRHQIRLNKSRLNSELNAVFFSFTYDQRVKVRMKLTWVLGHWKVKRVLIRQKKGCEGEVNKSFIWDF